MLAIVVSRKKRCAFAAMVLACLLLCILIDMAPVLRHLRFVSVLAVDDVVGHEMVDDP